MLVIGVAEINKLNSISPLSKANHEIVDRGHPIPTVFNLRVYKNLQPVIGISYNCLPEVAFGRDSKKVVELGG